LHIESLCEESLNSENPSWYVIFLQFKQLIVEKNFHKDDASAGREEFVHPVERICDAVEGYSLRAVVEQRKKPEHAHFAPGLMLHGKTEEKVSYPAAPLIVQYLKLSFERYKLPVEGWLRRWNCAE
jgi:hypothetical protein